jgi:hypothetical protein
MSHYDDNLSLQKIGRIALIIELIGEAKSHLACQFRAHDGAVCQAKLAPTLHGLFDWDESSANFMLSVWRGVRDRIGHRDPPRCGALLTVQGPGAKSGRAILQTKALTG